MSTAKWMGLVAAVATLASAGTASAAAKRGPEATVRTYLAAIEANSATRVCAALGEARCPEDLYLDEAHRDRFVVRSTFVRGAHARVLLDAVAWGIAHRRPRLLRIAVVLSRSDGRWEIRAGGELPGLIGWQPHPLVDPGPTERGAALRRLADDELVALSSNSQGLMLCRLFAPSAPFARTGRCGGPSSLVYHDGAPESLQIRRLTLHGTGARTARIDLTVAASRAVYAPGRPGWRVVTRRFADTLRAVRIGGRWRLVKPSRAFYAALMVPAPVDVASASATATWPARVVAPSISRTPTPAPCRTPPVLTGATCPRLAGVSLVSPAGADPVLAWADERSRTQATVSTQVLHAGAPVDGAVAVRVPGDAPGGVAWTMDDGGLIAVGGGALLLEQSVGVGGVRAVPLDAAGHVRGPASTVVPSDGFATDIPIEAAAAPPEATGASLLLVDDRVDEDAPLLLVRLGADGAPVGVPVPLEGTGALHPHMAAASLPDGGVLLADVDVSAGGAVAVRVRRLGPDGRQVGVAARQAVAAGTSLGAAPSAAVDGSGHALVSWEEKDAAGRVSVRAWPVDAGVLLSTSPPRTVDTQRAWTPADPADPYDGWGPSPVVRVGSAPDGSWTLAWTVRAGDETAALWAARVDRAGAPLTRPRRLAGAVEQVEDEHGGVAAAATTVAWVAAAQTGASAQIRAAPLP